MTDEIALRADGAFGRWNTDRYGLPVYEYTCDQDNDPVAETFTTQGPSRLHWRQIGNDRINAIATNRYEYLHGYGKASGASGVNVAPLLPSDQFPLSTPTFDLAVDNGTISFSQKKRRIRQS